MRGFWFLCCLPTLLALSGPAYGLPPLQLYVELTPPGEVLRPPPGEYAGPVVIRRPIVLDGGGEVTVDGGGRGTVLTVRADGAVVKGLRLTNSGESFDRVDSGLLLEANDVQVEDNVIDDVLFGIQFKQASGNVVRGNRISSRAADIGLRGDGIRMWYSHENLIENNRIEGVRDLYFTNSTDNRIVGNHVSGSRVGMEFVFSHGNVVEDNTISNNTTGVVVIYSNDMEIRNNRLEHYRDTAGSALAFKDSSNVVVEGNEVLHCAIGVIANAPIHPENILYLTGNRFAYNNIAIHFYGEKGGHVIRGNRFEENFVEVSVTAVAGARGHDWNGNYWDTYEGFDRNGDGIGDTPHDVYLYSDRIWMDRPMTSFFRGAPLFEMADLVERLAPFSRPELVLSDPSPRVR